MQGKLTLANTMEQFDAGDCDGGDIGNTDVHNNGTP
jgi:hypothetical protein